MGQCLKIWSCTTLLQIRRTVLLHGEQHSIEEQDMSTQSSPGKRILRLLQEGALKRKDIEKHSGLSAKQVNGALLGLLQKKAIRIDFDSGMFHVS